MSFRSKFLLVSAGAALLAGCAQTPSVTPVATEPDIVTVKLAQAADKASQALDSIASIEQQRSPATPPSQQDYSNVPPNLMQPISIRWSGPIDLIAKTLAERAGMRFHVRGSVPPVPLTVNVDAYQQPILHILRDIGLQAGRRADLSVDAASGLIELRYAAGDQNEIPYAHAGEIDANEIK